MHRAQDRRRHGQRPRSGHCAGSADPCPPDLGAVSRLRRYRAHGSSTRRGLGRPTACLRRVRRRSTTQRCTLRKVLEAHRRRWPARRPETRSAIPHGLSGRSVPRSRVVVGGADRRRIAHPGARECTPLHVHPCAGQAPVRKGAPGVDGVPCMPLRSLHRRHDARRALTPTRLRSVRRSSGADRWRRAARTDAGGRPVSRGGS